MTIFGFFKKKFEEGRAEVRAIKKVLVGPNQEDIRHYAPPIEGSVDLIADLKRILLEGYYQDKMGEKSGEAFNERIDYLYNMSAFISDYERGRPGAKDRLVAYLNDEVVKLDTHDVPGSTFAQILRLWADKVREVPDLAAQNDVRQGPRV